MVARPEYANLGACAPDVTQARIDLQQHVGYFEFTTPAGCGPQTWHFASYEVPDPSDWFAPQRQVDHKAITYRKMSVDTTHEVALKLPDGPCQIDMWLAGQEQPYATDVVGIDAHTLVPNGEVCGTPPPPTTTTTTATTTTSTTVATTTSTTSTPSTTAPSTTTSTTGPTTTVTPPAPTTTRPDATTTTAPTTTQPPVDDAPRMTVVCADGSTGFAGSGGCSWHGGFTGTTTTQAVPSLSTQRDSLAHTGAGIWTLIVLALALLVAGGLALVANLKREVRGG